VRGAGLELGLLSSVVVVFIDDEDDDLDLVFCHVMPFMLR
jgi:hypothetical protein